MKHLKKQYYPMAIIINTIHYKSFTGMVLSSKMNIINKGLILEIKVKYQHKISSTSLSCEYLHKLKTKNPLKCPIYFAMKQQYQFNEQNLKHLNEFNHFHNEF